MEGVGRKGVGRKGVLLFPFTLFRCKYGCQGGGGGIMITQDAMSDAF